MQRFYQSNYSSKSSYKILSQRTPHREAQQDKANQWWKIQMKPKIYNKKNYMPQYLSQRRSQKSYKKQIEQISSNRKTSLSKPKIYRSYSSSKNKISKISKDEQFLIRIPKDQNLIQKYIQQLKKIKRKMQQEKKSLSRFKKQNNTRQFHSNTNNLDQNLQLFQDKQGKIRPPKLCIAQRKPQVLFRQVIDNNIFFSRDIKKHKRKLKIVKQFIDENQFRQELIQDEQQINCNQICADQQEVKQQLNSKREDIFGKLFPKEMVRGNMVNIRQSSKMQDPAHIKQFNRYSSQGGRRLYSIGKSIDIRQSPNIKRNRNDKHKLQDSRSLVLRRRKTQQTDKKHEELSSLKTIQLTHNQYPAKDKDKDKDKDKRSTDKLGPSQVVLNRDVRGDKSPQKLKYKLQCPAKLPFKSIEGYSTIEDKKQTFDILGESCLEIRQNLIKSNKKMDHILDLLGYDTAQLKQNCLQKEKRRKTSYEKFSNYERFSKAFPKGFFK